MRDVSKRVMKVEFVYVYSMKASLRKMIYSPAARFFFAFDWS